MYKKYNYRKPVSFRKQLWTLIGAIVFFGVCSVIAGLNIIQANDFWVPLSSGVRSAPAGVLFIGANVLMLVGIFGIIKTVIEYNNKKL